MARLVLQVNLGPQQSLGALAAVVDDLSIVLDLGLRTDVVAARRDAENEIERWWTEQPGQLLESPSPQDERLSTELERLLERRRAEEELADQLAGAPPRVWLDEWYRIQRLGRMGTYRRFVAPPPFWSPLAESPLSEIAPDLYARLVENALRDHLPGVPAVERMDYENPFEIVLVGLGVLTAAGFKFGTFSELAKLIRDWPAERRAGQARAREAEATARQAEGRVEREEAEVDRTRAETRELNARASKAELEAEVLRLYALQGNRLDDLIEVGLAPRELQAIARLGAMDVDVELDDDEG